MKTKMILIALAVTAFTWSTGSAVAAPTSLTDNGAVYTVTDTKVGTQDYKFTRLQVHAQHQFDWLHWWRLLPERLGV